MPNASYTMYRVGMDDSHNSMSWSDSMFDLLPLLDSDMSAMQVRCFVAGGEIPAYSKSTSILDSRTGRGIPKMRWLTT